MQKLVFEYVGNENVSKFDMKYDTKTGEIYLESKDEKYKFQQDCNMNHKKEGVIKHE